MIEIVVVSSVIIVISYSIMMFKSRYSKLMIGHGLLLDILFGVLVTGAAMITGSLTGMLVSVFSGLLITLALTSAKACMPYQRIERVRKANGKLSLFKWHIVNYEPCGFKEAFSSSVSNRTDTMKTVNV